MEELCQEGTDRESSEFPEKPRGKDHFSSWNHLCGQPSEIRGKSPRDVRNVGHRGWDSELSGYKAFDYYTFRIIKFSLR